MQTRLVAALLVRIRADFEDETGDMPTLDGERITAHGMRFPADLEFEQLVASVADRMQDTVVQLKAAAWPSLDGKPLSPSADSGVACWCVDGKPWCAVGQLRLALYARESHLTPAE